MKRLAWTGKFPVVFGLLILWTALTAGNCSRTRVESLTRMNEGVGLASQRQYLQAVEKLQQAVAIDPTNDQAFWNLAIVHMETQAYTAARDDLKRASEIVPTNPSYFEKLGTVHLQLGEIEAAKDAFEKAIGADANFAKAYLKLAQVHERLDQPQEALQRYTEAVQKGPRLIEAYRALGRLYADLGFLDQSTQVLRAGLSAAVEGTREKSDMHQILGTVYQQQRNYPLAVEEFKKSLEIERTNSEALFSLGWTFALMDNREEARRFLRRFLDSAGPDTPDHYRKAAQDRLGQLTAP